MSRAESGRRAEDIAAKALARRGYRILERNFRCRYGEIDCAAIKDGMLVIVEVKSGRGKLPYERIDENKRRRLATLAEVFAQRKGLEHLPVRFDAVIVDLESDSVEIVEDAF